MQIINNFIGKNLVILDIYDWLSNSAERQGQGILTDVWRSFCMLLCKVFYTCFAYFYRFFIALTDVELLKQKDFESFYSRITILLGLIMMFVVIFYLIRLLLSPDRITDKEIGVGNLFKKIVIVVLLLGFTPKIFSILLHMQHIVLESQLIPKIILGETKEEADMLASGDNIIEYGRILSIKTFKTFYTLSDESGELDTRCGDYNLIEEDYIKNGRFDIAESCLNLTGNLINPTSNSEYTGYVIHFDALPAVVVGLLMLWMIIVYNLNVGVRIFQLTYLQIIAPIPIISYILPSNNKDSMFNRWVKQVTTTYIDIFIRVAIIYFVIYLSSISWNMDLSYLFPNTTNSEWMIRWTRVILTLSLFLFARRAPQLLQELTGKPSAASIGFGLGGRNAAAGLLMGSTRLAVMNAIGSTGAARFTGFARGLARGAMAGTAEGNYQQNMDRATQRERENNRTDEWLKMQGYGWASRHWNRAVIASGGIPRAQREFYIGDSYDRAKAAIDNDDDMKYFNALESTAMSQGIGAAASSIVQSGQYEYDDTTGELKIKDRFSNDVLKIDMAERDAHGNIIRSGGKAVSTILDASGNIDETELQKKLTSQMDLRSFDRMKKTERRIIWGNPRTDDQRYTKEQYTRLNGRYGTHENISDWTDADRVGKLHKAESVRYGGIPYGTPGAPQGPPR